MAELIPLKIDRRTWLRGEGASQSFLLREADGKMCCLGFACLAAGLLLRFRPDLRVTEAWARASAVLGLVLSAYQVSAALPLLSGTSSTVTVIAVGAFSVFAAVHVFLLWAGSPIKAAKAK